MKMHFETQYQGSKNKLRHGAFLHLYLFQVNKQDINKKAMTVNKSNKEAIDKSEHQKPRTKKQETKKIMSYPARLSLHRLTLLP